MNTIVRSNIKTKIEIYADYFINFSSFTKIGNLNYVRKYTTQLLLLQLNSNLI